MVVAGVQIVHLPMANLTSETVNKSEYSIVAGEQIKEMIKSSHFPLNFDSYFVNKNVSFIVFFYWPASY
jgi:hypothetical protein